MAQKILWIIGILAVILVLISINSNHPSEVINTAQPIRIGAILSETGVAAAFGEMSHKGIALAAQEINAAGGINGRKVEVTYEDDRTDPKTAAGAYQKLTGINTVDGIIGSNFDFVTQPLFSLAKEGSIVVISPSNPRIPGAFDTNARSFVMMTEFDAIVRVFKSYLEKASYKQLGMLRFESAFAEQIEKSLNGIQVELGRKPLVVETYKAIGTNDFKTQILKLKQAGVDMVFLDMVAADPLTFMKQAGQLNYSPKIITHIGLQDALAIPDVDPKIFNSAVVLNWNVTSGDFGHKFEEAYKVLPDKSANRAYDAVYILANAVAKAKDKSQVASVLESTEFATPNGPFAFNKNHAASSTAVVLEIIKDGKRELYQP